MEKKIPTVEYTHCAKNLYIDDHSWLRIMPFFEHNGTKIHYVDVDKRDDRLPGISLVFVHGAGSSHLIWSLQIREFSKTFRTIALDLSGHGKSDEGVSVTSVDGDFTTELVSLIEYLKLNEFILAGHSMGGGIVMSYALKANVPKPMALVLVDTSYELQLSKLRTGLIKETIDDRIYFFKHQVYEDYTESYQLKKLEDDIRISHPRIMARDIAACRNFSIADRVGEIDLPTFILVGEHDDIITPAMASQLEKKFPRADIAVVRNADHIPMVENPEEFNRLFGKFVEWVVKSR
jgi:3-oxoadipate enol-lactonase